MEGNMRGPSTQDCEKSFARTGVPSANMLAKKNAAANLGLTNLGKMNRGQASLGQTSLGQTSLGQTSQGNGNLVQIRALQNLVGASA
jgi:hypothetical protein